MNGKPYPRCLTVDPPPVLRGFSRPKCNRGCNAARSEHGKPRRPSPPRRLDSLDDVERQTLLDTLHEPRFVDLAPAEVFAMLLDEGRYLGSVPTMRRQPPLDRRLVSGTSTNRLIYGARASRFLGRDAELKQFAAFIGDPAPFLWWSPAGAGGTGKSRLAQEFGLGLGEDSFWGFLACHPFGGAPPSDWRDWRWSFAKVERRGLARVRH